MQQTETKRSLFCLIKSQKTVPAFPPKIYIEWNSGYSQRFLLLIPMGLRFRYCLLGKLGRSWTSKLGLKSKLCKASVTKSCCLTTCYQHRMKTSKTFCYHNNFSQLQYHTNQKHQEKSPLPHQASNDQSGEVYSFNYIRKMSCVL